MVTARYGARRGSVSGSFLAYRVEYRRVNVITGQMADYAAVVYARTDTEASRKATKNYGGLPGAVILRVYCIEERKR